MSAADHTNLLVNMAAQVGAIDERTKRLEPLIEAHDARIKRVEGLLAVFTVIGGVAAAGFRYLKSKWGTA